MRFEEWYKLRDDCIRRSNTDAKNEIELMYQQNCNFFTQNLSFICYFDFRYFDFKFIGTYKNIDFSEVKELIIENKKIIFLYKNQLQVEHIDIETLLPYLTIREFTLKQKYINRINILKLKYNKQIKQVKKNKNERKENRFAYTETYISYIRLRERISFLLYIQNCITNLDGHHYPIYSHKKSKDLQEVVNKFIDNYSYNKFKDIVQMVFKHEYTNYHKKSIIEKLEKQIEFQQNLLNSTKIQINKLQGELNYYKNL